MLLVAIVMQFTYHPVKTHVIAEGIGAIKLIIMMHYVYISCFDCLRCANLKATSFFLLFFSPFYSQKSFYSAIQSYSKTQSPPPTNHLLSKCQQECVFMLYLLHLWPI